MAKNSLKVAAIQMSCNKDVNANFERAKKFAELAAKRDAELIAFGELGFYEWFCAEINEDVLELAEAVDGKLIPKICALAKNTGVAIITPLFEKAEDKYYNSMVVIDASGELKGVYRQAHVPQLVNWEQRSYFQASGELKIFELCGWKVGVQIGWDNFFPEGARALALMGAELIIAPTASGANSEDLWQRAISANALFNGLYIVRANRTGKEKKVSFYGSSFCADPVGDIVAGPLGESDGVLICELDKSAVIWARKMWPFFADRKPEMYKGITDKRISEDRDERG